MAVGTFRLPVFTTQDPATYKANIDAGFAVNKRLNDAFAPHAQTTPNMTVALDAGFIFGAPTLTEVAAQNTAAIAASSRAGITRIDRVVVDQITGAVSVVSGTSVAPSIPSGKMPVSQVAVTTASTGITNAMLTDERAFPQAPARSLDYQAFTSTAAANWAAPAGFSSNALVQVAAWAGGGGGGSGGGGGGGACLIAQFSLGQLTTSVAVTVGNGGAAGNAGGNTSFGGYFTVYGGGVGGSGDGGGGGGTLGASTAVAYGGAPQGGEAKQASGEFYDSVFGGGGGGDNNVTTSEAVGGDSVYGGGGGGGGNTGGQGGNGGRSLYGGGGGAGESVGAARTGGVSVFGGNGGNGSTATANAGTAGTAPGGGGGNDAAGARGEVRVWVFP